MSLIKVDLPYTIFDGAAVSFKSPADFSEVTGLRIYYPNTSGAIQASDFTFADANRNDVTNIDKLFGADAIVKVILDTDSNLAFVQNADTNAYLEAQLASKAPVGYVEEYFVTDKAGEMDEILVSVFDSMSEKTKKVVYISHNIDETHTIGVSGGNWFFTLHKFVSAYGIIEGVKYDSNPSNPPMNIMKNKAANSEGDGIWGDWMWVNPPMINGIEYRTTERINGTTVYKKRENDIIYYRVRGDSTWRPYTTAIGGVDAWAIYANIFNVSEATYEKITTDFWGDIPVRTGFSITLRSQKSPYTAFAVGYKNDNDYGSFIFMHYAGATSKGVCQYVNYYNKTHQVTEIT